MRAFLFPLVSSHSNFVRIHLNFHNRLCSVLLNLDIVALTWVTSYYLS